MKKQLQFERAQKLRKEVKDDTVKYEETITELNRKGQIRKFKQISYWSTLKPAKQKKQYKTKTIPKSSIPVLEIVFWFKHDAVLRNCFRFVFFELSTKSAFWIHFVRGRGSSHYVDLIIGGCYLMMMLDYKRGRGVQKSRKK